MFNLAVISDEISQDFQTVINLISEFRDIVNGVEIRSVWDKPPQKLTNDDMVKMKAILDEANIKVVGIASPFYKCDIDNEQERREHIDILRQCIKLAQFFGTNLVRGFAFWNTGRTEEIWDRIIDYYQEPIKIAENEGIIIGLENEASTSISTAKLAVRFISEIDSPNLKAIWDPANELYAVGGEKPYPDAYDRIKHVMVHCHAKDANLNDEGKLEPVPVGRGLIDWRGQIEALIDSGYQGYLSLETHWRPRKVLSEDLLNRPGGSAFSEAGDEATRVCLINLINIIREVLASK